MSNFKRGRHLRIRTVVVFLFTISFAALFTACTDSGSVGGGIAGPETNIEFDTLNISSLSVDTLYAYTGNLNFFSVGRFKDPLYGNITVTALFKPRLASNSDSLSIDKKTNIYLKLAVKPETEYGDTLASQKFSLFAAKELWRGNQWRIHDNIKTGTAPLATFNVGSKDTTIQVPLPRKWVNEYAKYFNSTQANKDSTYVREFLGLVMKPQNDHKIITINPFNSSFLATNVDIIPDSTSVDTTRLDSLSFGLREWAFRVKRTNVNPAPKSSSKLISSYERVIRFDFDFSFEDIGTEDIAKVELIFYVDNVLLSQSINKAGPHAARPASKILNLYYVEEDELPQSLTSNAPLDQAEYNKEDQSYHLNVTRAVLNGFFKATNDKRVFYLTIGTNEGVLRSGLIFNSLTTGKAPKVVVSYIETENL